MSFLFSSVTKHFQIAKNTFSGFPIRYLEKKSSDNWYFQLNVSLSLQIWFNVKKNYIKYVHQWCMIKNYSFYLFFVAWLLLRCLWLSIRHHFYESWIDVHYPEHSLYAVFSHVWCTISTRALNFLCSVSQRFMLPQIHFIHMRLNINSCHHMHCKFLLIYP